MSGLLAESPAVAGESAQRKRHYVMIQQVLNKQLLQDLLDGMEGQALTFVSDQRRSDTGTPMDEMNPVERAELLEEALQRERNR